MTAVAVSATTAYAESVVSGDVVAGQLVRWAAERHLRDLETGHERGLTFDERAAEKAIAFFPLLRHSKGEWAGQAFRLEPWQAFIVGSLFGWKRADGLRRFRTAYLSVARKNGKSTTVAGIGIKLAFFDDEPGSEVYAAATKRDQAKITWSEAQRMVQRSPGFAGRIKAFTNNLHDANTASKYEPLSADYNSLDGLNVHGAVIDEYHAHPNGNVADVLESATGARRQPLIIYTTTAGHDNESACHQFDTYICSVLEGTVDDDAVFGFIARPDEGDAWDDPVSWAKANPNLGVSVKLDDLERQCDRAKQIPREQNEFRRKRCNEWTEQAERWLDLALWDGCDGDTDDSAGRMCFGGLDLSTTTDLSALALLFPNGDGSYDLDMRFWCPEEGIQKRSQADKVPYDVWARQGYLTPTPGNVVDYEYIELEVEELASRYQIVELGFDPWNATQLATRLLQKGANVVKVAQGYQTLSEPSRELEKLLMGGLLRHGGHPVLRWMAANVAVQEGPNGSIRPSKDRSHERIDGIVAVVIALSRAMVHQQAAVSEPRSWSWNELPA